MTSALAGGAIAGMKLIIIASVITNAVNFFRLVPIIPHPPYL
jgi:hypothetical protein